MKTKPKQISTEKSYSAFYLAVILASVLLLEGILLGGATSSTWLKSLEVLDVTSGLEQMADSVAVVVEPMMEQYKSVETFYHLAAEEMIVLLENESDPLMLVHGINDFYTLATVEMEKLLDMSDSLAYWPQVAGASISR